MNDLPDGGASDLAIKRYDTVLRYYVYENTVYWSRSQFFLVANAGLFAVFAAIAEKQQLASMMVAIVGFFLSSLWFRILKSSQYWTTRWEGICCSLEEAAFGATEVLRNCRAAGHLSTKKSAQHSAVVFIFLWIGCFIFEAWPWLKALWDMRTA